MVSLSKAINNCIACLLIQLSVKKLQHDNIKYKSALGDGYNVALFDLNAAELTHCYLFQTKKISYSFEAIEEAQYSTPLGKYLDDPQAAEDFLKRIREVTNSNINIASDKDSDNIRLDKDARKSARALVSLGVGAM